jgi:hypothetical protein
MSENMISEMANQMKLGEALAIIMNITLQAIREEALQGRQNEALRLAAAFNVLTQFVCTVATAPQTFVIPE